MPHALLTARLPRSGNAALASGALFQAAVGAEFLLAGLNKLLDPDYLSQFRGFVRASPGATRGPFGAAMQALVVPNSDLVAHASRFIEMGAGAILLFAALEVLRRRLSGSLGVQHGYEPLVALTSAVAAILLAGMSMSIYLLQGGTLPALNPGFAFASPIAIELLLVPLALGIAWLEFGRFRALRAAGPTRWSISPDA